jgi:hypothetical protein
MRPYRLVSPVAARAAALASAVEEPAASGPIGVELEPGRPNPATGLMQIGFALPSPGWVDLRVYDLQGRQVRVLASQSFAAGRSSVTWDGTDAAGRRVPSGVYLYRLQAGAVLVTRRVVRL